MNQVIDRQEELWHVVKEQGFTDDSIVRLKRIIHPCFTYYVLSNNNPYGRLNDLVGNIERLREYTREALEEDVGEYEAILTNIFTIADNAISNAMVALVNQYVVFCQEIYNEAQASTTQNNNADSDSD